MIRKGNKYIITIRSPKDLEDIKNNIAKYKEELKDGEQLEIQIAKSGKYVLKMIVSKSDVRHEISTDDKKYELVIQDENDATALKKLVQILLAIAFSKPN